MEGTSMKIIKYLIFAFNLVVFVSEPFILSVFNKLENNGSKRTIGFKLLLKPRNLI